MLTLQLILITVFHVVHQYMEFSISQLGTQSVFVLDVVKCLIIYLMLSSLFISDEKNSLK